MKLHKLEVYVIDFEDHGVENIANILEDTFGLSVSVMHAETADIKEWVDPNDDHILNSTTNVEDFRRYFPQPYVSMDDYLDGPMIKLFRD